MAGINGFPGFLSDFVVGSTRDFVIRLTRDIPVAGTVVDLTGCKFYITIAKDKDINTPPELEILIDPPTDPLNGQTDGEITDDQTMALGVGTFYYSVRYINSAGAAYVIDMGRIKGLAGVSNRVS